MNDSLVLYSCVLLLGTFIGSVSQVILKKAAQRKYATKAAEYLNFPVVFAYALFVLTTLMCIFAYRVVPLSFGPILESTSYLYVTAFGAIVFKEKITARKAFALVLILAGIMVYAISMTKGSI